MSITVRTCQSQVVYGIILHVLFRLNVLYANAKGHSTFVGGLNYPPENMQFPFSLNHNGAAQQPELGRKTCRKHVAEARAGLID